MDVIAHTMKEFEEFLGILKFHRDSTRQVRSSNMHLVIVKIVYNCNFFVHICTFQNICSLPKLIRNLDLV